MEGYGPQTYGDLIAAHYDDLYTFDAGPAVSFLAPLADDGPALELGIGTGRVALPLARAGVTVHGVDASRAMLARLALKEGGRDVVAINGDFERIPVASSTYRLVFVVFNTFFALTTQDAQLKCMEEVARVLRPGGLFVLEQFVPDPGLFAGNQRVVAERVSLDGFTLEVSRLDPVAQRIDGQVARFTQEGLRLFPLSVRYVFVGELDLMARIVGLGLKERWTNWAREPFRSASGQHVSVYEKPAD